MSQKTNTVREGWTGPGRRDAVIEPLALKEDGLHLDVGARGMYEWWYFDAHLDTGHTLVVFFHASNPNPGRQGKTGIEIVLLGPDGKRTQAFFPYPRSAFSAARDRPEVRIGTNTITSEQRDGELPVYEIHVMEKDLGCHLRYRAEVNGWKPGTGLSQFGDMGYFAWIVPFARASVEGTVTAGDQTIQVSGIGYHDHNWLNFQFQKIIDYWMWGRVYSEHFTVAYAYIQCNAKVDKHAVQVVMLAEGQEVILSTGELELLKEDFAFDARAEHHFPRKLNISAGKELEVNLNVRQVLEAQNLLEDFNPTLRLVARHILRLKPGYFRLLSDFTLSASRGGETMQESGTTLHEIVIFTPMV